MGKEILIFRDKAGNRLFKKFNKRRGNIQVSGKNRLGRTVSSSGFMSLIRKARAAKKFKL